MPHEFDGKKYRKVSSHQREWGEKLIAELALRGDESVLDLGCGDGGLTAFVAERLPKGRVVGVDASEGMIETADELAGGNLSFRRTAIEEIDFDAEFDVIFSNAALHWVKDHPPMLSRVHRALKTGGVIRFNFAGDGNCANFYRIAKDAIKRAEFALSFADFVWPWYMPSVEEYRRVMSETQFRDVRVWGEKADRPFEDRKSFVGWIDQPCLVPFLARVDPAMTKWFREYVVDRMTRETSTGDGRYFETFRRINVQAKK